jgi:hypothetical protein
MGVRHRPAARGIAGTDSTGGVTKGKTPGGWRIRSRPAYDAMAAGTGAGLASANRPFGRHFRTNSAMHWRQSRLLPRWSSTSSTLPRPSCQPQRSQGTPLNVGKIDSYVHGSSKFPDAVSSRTAIAATEMPRDALSSHRDRRTRSGPCQPPRG